MAGWVDGWMMGTRAPCLYLRWYLVTVCPMCALLALYCTFIWCMAAVQVLYASSAMSFLYYRIVLLCPRQPSSGGLRVPVPRGYGWPALPGIRYHCHY